MRDHDRMDTRFLGIAELAEAPSAAVVVDVMRAFTVAAWAFAQGTEKIVLAESLDEALALKARHPDWVGAQGRSANDRVRRRQLAGPAAVG
jgi:2-phosphosulfolactate phosphatase